MPHTLIVLMVCVCVVFFFYVPRGRSVTNGHYVTFVKHDDGWYKYNDEEVRLMFFPFLFFF
jgi:ubiquitin C-terminal hydrolase